MAESEDKITKTIPCPRCNKNLDMNARSSAETNQTTQERVITPRKDCPACKGTGIIVIKKIIKKTTPKKTQAIEDLINKYLS